MAINIQELRASIEITFYTKQLQKLKQKIKSGEYILTNLNNTITRGRK